MPQSVRLILALHNHQPVGNFDHVFRQAYEDSYRPFLEVFSRFEPLRIALHLSGPLFEWLEAYHPEYLDRVGELARRGRVEIIGGAYYEPILAMIPACDRQGQIRAFRRRLQERFGVPVRGMWVAERVWEQSFTRDLVDAGVEYTILDDFHFKAAGLEDRQLAGYMTTEDEGRVLAVFPGSERLRYLIPFGDPEETVEYLAQRASEHPSAVITFGDDGEKFGTWPETKKHVYEDGWLERFFQVLVDNHQWLQTTTPSEVLDSLPPAGKVYLPDCSYREMTEWVLPAERLLQFERLAEQMKDDPRWPALRGFMRGGFWRNFRVKYPEANEMYARMMIVSRRLQQRLGRNEGDQIDEPLRQARTELYRGQCNCAYWHGAFGGLYLPHLRHAVYRHLIAADNLLDRAEGRRGPWVEAVADDFDFDTLNEVRLANDRLWTLISPARGGHLLELDVRCVCHNLLATLTRRPEAYHQKVLAGAQQAADHCASIHDRVVFKQQDLDKRLQYDAYPRKALVDLFFHPETTLDAVARGTASQSGDFATGTYEARIRRNPDRIQVQLSRTGTVEGHTIKLSKAVTLAAGSERLQIAYLLEDLPPEARWCFAVELNFAGLPAGEDDRFFADAEGRRLGHLGTRLDLAPQAGLSLRDEYLGLEAALRSSRPTAFWTFPVESVSQSEGGFELVHQSVAVIPHWIVQPDAEGRWGVTFELALNTQGAENRHNHGSMAAAAQR